MVVVMLCLGRIVEAQMVSAPVIEAPSAPIVTGGQTAALLPSTVALQMTSPLALYYGESVDGLAQVTANDGSAVTGTVAFYDGTTVFCRLVLMDGASCPAGITFAAGTHVFTAAYSGDVTHAGATSNAVTVVVKQDATATSLASSVNPVAAGGNVVYTAVVQGQHGAATGTVSFMNGGVAMGEVMLDGAGMGSLAVLMMTPGTHAITGVYAGNANSAGSSSAAVNELVEAPLAASTTTISASTNTVQVGSSVNFSARVSAAVKVATGTITFVEGGTVLGSAMLDGRGVAVWTTSSLSAGQHSIVARYAGDAATAASLSQAVVITVDDAGVVGGFTLGLSQVTVSAGGVAVVPIRMTAGASAGGQPVTASCTGLPDEATCEYVAGTVRIQTAGPRDCGTTTPYGVAHLPLAAPVAAGLLLMFGPRRRRTWKGLLAVVGAVLVLGSVSGCGTGNCTDLGSRPGTYTVGVGLSRMSGVQKVVLVVKP